MNSIGIFSKGYMFFSPIPRSVHTVKVSWSDCPELPKRLHMLATLEDEHPVMMRGKDEKGNVWIQFKYKEFQISYCQASKEMIDYHLSWLKNKQFFDGERSCKIEINTPGGFFKKQKE